MKRWSKNRSWTAESLEKREMMAAFGFPWPNAHHLTVSFAPDGTHVGDSSSKLFAKLDAVEPTENWKSEVLRAFEAWAAEANVDFGVVPDNGEEFGVTGLSRGDTRFGDIRIAAIGLNSSNLSVSVPHDPALSGTWAGDILINADSKFGTGGADLYSVMLHEIGHVLGLDHSADPTSVMYSHAGKQYAGLASIDRVAVQQLYGARSPDANDRAAPNDAFAQATRIKSESSYTGAAPLAIFGDITTPSDVDYYWFRPVSGYSGPTTIEVRSTSMSPLKFHMTVFDQNGTQLGHATSLNVEGGAVAVTLPQVDSGKKYYVKVQSATSGEFAIGRYATLVSFDSLMTVSPTVVDEVLRQPIEDLEPSDIDEIFLHPDEALFNDDSHGDDDFPGAPTLTAVAGYPLNSEYELVASITDVTDVDTYRFLVGTQLLANPVLTASVTAIDGRDAGARLQLFDRYMNPAPIKILANGNGTFSFEATGLDAGQHYFVKVVRSATAASENGNYALSMHVGSQRTKLDPLASGSFSGAATSRSDTLIVGQTQVFQVLLSVGQASADQSVLMTIEDDRQHLLYSLTATALDSASGSALLLRPGKYRVTYKLNAPLGTGAPPVAFQSFVTGLTVPIGPGTIDPTSYPGVPNIYQMPYNTPFIYFPFWPYYPPYLSWYVSYTQRFNYAQPTTRPSDAYIQRFSGPLR